MYNIFSIELNKLSYLNYKNIIITEERDSKNKKNEVIQVTESLSILIVDMLPKRCCQGVIYVRLVKGNEYKNVACHLFYFSQCGCIIVSQIMQW